MRILYLLPNLLHEQATWPLQPPALDALIAESEKAGRQYLKRYALGQRPIYLLNEHTRNPLELLQLEEERVGLISDAGMPCLADPGADLIWAARQKGIEIHAFPGPSSIVLALVLSGLPGQKFTFHGYLERDTPKLEQQIRALPKKMTHIFIETPYRNQKMLEQLLRCLHDQDRLSIAIDLTGPEEQVISLSVKEWKRAKHPLLDKRPAVFLLFKG
jgi:16S rRNA (cytidine1402-2'-O)-methyltransferase